ncbi:MAG TPA: DUF4215 domain-containing protein [Candidatus Binatia bacterium]|nr:DUF4215 domain-containing protein [Candidatus Binatia bacterium]
MKLTIALTTILAFTGVATAGITAPDHLHCYKIKDSNDKLIFTLNMSPDAGGLPEASGCTVKTKSKEFCTPAVKTLVEPPNPVNDVDGQRLTNGFLCYKLKCPKATLNDMHVSDQFGTRTISGFKVKRVCVPSETAIATTTTVPETTTTLIGAVCGNSQVEGDEACDDAPPAESGDGCSSECTEEIGFDCTGSPSVCSSVCGDGIIVAGEECDDAPPADNGDGCSAQCAEEPGFTCVGQPSVCVPDI